MPADKTAKMRLIGAEELQDLLKELPIAAQKKVAKQMLRRGGRVIIKAARAKVPVRSGELKNSITLSATAPGERAAPTGLYIGFRKPHSRRAHLTEFGTARIKAHPFMRPAIDEKGPEALQAIAKSGGPLIEKEAGRLAKKLRTKK